MDSSLDFLDWILGFRSCLPRFYHTITSVTELLGMDILECVRHLDVCCFIQVQVGDRYRELRNVRDMAKYCELFAA
jgi:hypothetical protein